MDIPNYLGIVVGGSLEQGLEVRLESPASVEDINVGTFVTVQGNRSRFFGIITDVSLGVSDPRLRFSPPAVSDTFIHQVLLGTTAFGIIAVRPTLIIPAVRGDDTELLPAKTVPPHFSRVYLANEADVEVVFGKEDKRHFWIGNPLDMETKVCLDLRALVERSNGIFGKSGTGKTFLTRLLLTGILQSDVATSLVFDMHNEYGWKGVQEGGREVKGLKPMFPSKVAIFSLDEASSRRRGATPDWVVSIGYNEIEPADIELLRDTLNLSDIASSYTYSLEREWGSAWLDTFLDDGSRENLDNIAAKYSMNQQALGALRNRLQRLNRFDFLTSGSGNKSVKQILDYLDRGMHVILEFGRYGDNLAAYMLVANVLTRRIHQRYVARKEAAMAGGGNEPRPLVITIEEAHKFLGPAISSQTIFGTIAREMRKYNVTLLVIDQRPSAIDSEVMSQIGTKIACLLDNERDVDAVLTGVSGARELRSVLSRLDSRQQALILGHSVPVPVVVRTREYGSKESYEQIAQWTREGSSDIDQDKLRTFEEELEDLY